VKGRDRCTLQIHPDDARERGLTDGARVRVTSTKGAIEVPIEIDDAMMRGVVSLPHGFGHDRDGVRLQVATTQARGASLNDLTDEGRVDALSGVADFAGVPVTVQNVEARAAG
jgi:anaerobic selenocysteine-containing dehydrogenase